jgi:predicted HicB family RNase H-like nuclease
MEHSDAETLFRDVRRTLEQSKATTRCWDMAKHLKQLGFDFRDGTKPGHKVYVHDGLAPDFVSASYTCGHGSNPQLKPAYVIKVIRTLTRFESELDTVLGGQVMNIDPHAYNITIRRDTFEDEVLFEARVQEFPDLVEYGETYQEAYDLALDAIETTAQILTEKNRDMPAPSVPMDQYSGRVTLRLPKSLHRALALTAEIERVSLNQHLVSILSFFSGYEAAYRQTDVEGWNLGTTSAQPPSRAHGVRSKLIVVYEPPPNRQPASSWRYHS